MNPRPMRNAARALFAAMVVLTVLTGWSRPFPWLLLLGWALGSFHQICEHEADRREEQPWLRVPR